MTSELLVVAIVVVISQEMKCKNVVATVSEREIKKGSN